MKNIEVTYDALICENGTYEQGEAAFILPMTDELAAEYLAGCATDRGAVNLVETALEAVEVMENYRALKGYEGRAVDSADAARLQGAEIQGEARLRSIRKNKARTAVMLAHLDAALDELEKETRQKGRAYMFDAYRLRYMEGLTAEEVAEKLNTGKNSPARWCKQLNERLAVLLFGVDGLRRW